MSKKNTSILWGVVIGIISLLAIGWLINTVVSDSAGPAGGVAIAEVATDHAKGAEAGEGVVTLIEYSDFECPACSAYYPFVKELVDKRTDVRFIYRHYPLTQIHPAAMSAAVATEAAGKQGKFWEMHDIIFDNQQNWSGQGNANGFFEKYARDLGLDMDQFMADVDDEAVQQKVLDDRASGYRAGVRGTPSFFVNGERIPSNPQSIAEFNSIIDAAK
jgi:protein-disulfide isomerase